TLCPPPVPTLFPYTTLFRSSTGGMMVMSNRSSGGICRPINRGTSTGAFCSLSTGCCPAYCVSDPVETFPVLSIATVPPLLLLAALILLRALQTQHRAQRPGAIDPFLRWHLLLRTDIRSPGCAQDPREKYHKRLD